jgi:hypothetical protein
MSSPVPGPNPFTALRQFVRRPDVERCELCGQLLAAEHPHLLELPRRRIVCSCHPCAILFAGQEGARFRRIPQQAQLLDGFRLTDAQWDALLIPINLAFFFHNSQTGKVVALYPSPAGATEAQLPLDAWPELVELNPVLRELEPDVEAVLVDRVGPRREHYRAPIDECYKLVGLIRAHWRGLSGGPDVWEAVARFFEQLQAKAPEGSGDA